MQTVIKTEFRQCLTKPCSKAFFSPFGRPFLYPLNSFLTKSVSVVQICTRAVQLVSVKIVGSGCLTWRTFWKERFLCMKLFISRKMTKYCQKYWVFFSYSFEHTPNFVKDLYGTISRKIRQKVSPCLVLSHSRSLRAIFLQIFVYQQPLWKQKSLLFISFEDSCWQFCWKHCFKWYVFHATTHFERQRM